MPASTRTTWSDSRYARPSTVTVGASCAAMPCEHRRGAGAPRSRPSTAGPNAPARRGTSTRTWIVPWQPGLDPAAGRLEQDREVAGHEIGTLGEQLPQAVVLVGDLFAFVEDEA